MQGERQAAVCERRVCGEAVKLLHADVERGGARSVVVDGVMLAGGRPEMRWCLAIKTLFQRPRHQRVECMAKIVCREVGQAAPSGKVGAEPVGHGCAEGCVREVWPGRFALRLSQERDAVAELLLGFAPGEPIRAEGCEARDDGGFGFRSRCRGALFARKRDCAEAADVARADRGRFPVEVDFIARDDAVSKKDKRRAAAEARAAVADLRKAAKEAEAQVEKLNRQKADLEKRLADPEVYNGPTAKLQDLQIRFGKVKQAIAEAEERWLDLQTQLEEA